MVHIHGLPFINVLTVCALYLLVLLFFVRRTSCNFKKAMNDNKYVSKFRQNNKIAIKGHHYHASLTKGGNSTLTLDYFSRICSFIRWPCTMQIHEMPSNTVLLKSETLEYWGEHQKRWKTNSGDFSNTSHCFHANTNLLLLVCKLSAYCEVLTLKFLASVSEEFAKNCQVFNIHTVQLSLLWLTHVIGQFRL